MLKQQDVIKLGLVQLTVWDSPISKVDTVDGRKNYLDWCQGEISRIIGKSRRAELIEGKDRTVAVFVSPSPDLKPE
jgi:hypothetical protein